MDTRTKTMPVITDELWRPEPEEMKPSENDTQVLPKVGKSPRTERYDYAVTIVRRHIADQFGSIPIPEFKTRPIFERFDSSEDWSIFIETDMPDGRIFNVRHTEQGTLLWEYDEVATRYIPNEN